MSRFSLALWQGAFVSTDCDPNNRNKQLGKFQSITSQRGGIGSQTAEAAFETDRWEKMENGVFDYRGLLIKGDAHEVRDPTVRENAMRLLKEKEPGAPFGEHPIVTSIIPKKRYKWGPWPKLTNQ